MVHPETKLSPRVVRDSPSRLAIFLDKEVLTYCLSNPRQPNQQVIVPLQLRLKNRI